jgi:FkbM family methyltransferase
MLVKAKQKILGAIWPPGNKASILRGPLKGYKFIVSENSGWSPIVGRWEPELQSLFTKIIKPGSLIYDLGANNGIHSLLFSKLTGPEGQVFSFEPLPDNCREIETNAELNHLKNINIVRAAVSNESGQTVFHLGLHNKQGSLVGIGRESGNDIKVQVITLDEFISNGKPAPDFLKIDIEGAEGMALLGFENQIDKIQPVFVIELHTPAQDAKAGAFFLKHHYNVYRITGKASYCDELSLSGVERIKDLTQPYPDPDGIWGTILAVHPGKLNLLKGR